MRHGFYRAVEFFVFAGIAAGGHPVGGKLDVAHFADVYAGNIGDGLANGHAAGSRRVKQRHGGLFAHAHGFALVGVEAHHGDGGIGHRRLIFAHHLVAVGEAAHAAVANGDEEVF